jgi:hypothetical protein
MAVCIGTKLNFRTGKSAVQGLCVDLERFGVRKWICRVRKQSKSELANKSEAQGETKIFTPTFPHENGPV